jgi:hypothetical protein
MSASDYTARMPAYRDRVEEKAFPDVFRLVRETTVSDNEGGFTNTPTTIASGSCRLRAIGGGSERVVADRLGWQTPYAVDLHPDVQLRTSDQLIVNGREFEIGAITRAGAWSVIITAICQEVG